MKVISLIILSLFLFGCKAPVIILDKDDSGNPIVIRGPQPNFENLCVLQKKYKVKTVISLRPKDEGSDFWLGINPSWYPKEKNNIEFLNDPEKNKAMKLLYRIKYQGWSREKTIREMESHRYDWSMTNRSAVKSFLRLHDFSRF